MRNHRKIFLLLIILIFVTFASATDYNITNCTTITQPGNYILQNDINITSLDQINIIDYELTTGLPIVSCLVINSGNVTLAGNNHFLTILNDTSLNYGGAVGISATGADSVIKNCIIKDYPIGIHLFFANNTEVDNNILSGKSLAGIQLTSSNYNFIYNNTISNTSSGGCGVSFYSSKNNSIYENTILGNSYGICLQDSVNNSIFQNNILNSNWGLTFVASPNNTIHYNNIISHYWNILRQAAYGNQDYNISAEHNWWGLTNSQSVINKFLEYNITNEYVDFAPFLCESFPTNLTSNESGLCLQDNDFSTDYNVTNCTTITEPGNYILQNDIVVNETWTCFEIQSSNVTLNLNGHSLLGDGKSNAIWSSSSAETTLINGSWITSYQPVDNITIKNGIIFNFSSGVSLSGLSSNVCFDENETNCTYLWYPSVNNTITNNTINYTENAIYMSAINYALLEDNILLNSNNGIALRTVTNILINGNTLLNNIEGLIFWENSSNNNVDLNLFIGNYEGIYGQGISNNSIKNNTFYLNDDGIALFNSSNNQLYNNFFNNTINFYNSPDNFSNLFNTTKTNGTNIMGGNFIGGNFWATPTRTGYSETCIDFDSDGFCDNSYQLVGENNTDYLPLAEKSRSLNFSANTIVNISAGELFRINTSFNPVIEFFIFVSVNDSIFENSPIAAKVYINECNFSSDDCEISKNLSLRFPYWTPTGFYNLTILARSVSNNDLTLIKTIYVLGVSNQSLNITSPINTTLPAVYLKLNNSDINSSEWENLTGNLNVSFERGNKLIAEFNYNFTNGTINFENITLEQGYNESGAVKGYVLIKGLDVTRLFGGTKTLYMDNLNSNLNWICIKDAEIDSIGEITANCKGTDEHQVQCNGQTKEGYTCTFNSTLNQYKITGLRHSGITQMTTPTCSDGIQNQDETGVDCGGSCGACNSGGSGSSGGGGGGSSKPKVNLTANNSIVNLSIEDIYKLDANNSINTNPNTDYSEISLNFKWIIFSIGFLVLLIVIIGLSKVKK